MNFKWDKKYLYWGVTAFLVIAAAIVFFLGLSQIKEILDSVFSFLSILTPVLYGFVIAYILCPIATFIEKPCLRRLFYTIQDKKREKFEREHPGEEPPPKTFPVRKVARVMSVAITMILALLILTGIIWVLLPQLIDTITMLVNNMPTYVTQISDWVSQTLRNYPEVEAYVLQFTGGISDMLNNWLSTELLPQMNNIWNLISSNVMNIISVFMNLLLGFVIAIYFLNSKELFAAQFKKILYCLFKPKVATKIINSTREVNKSFGQFITGKILDSFIIGMVYVLLIEHLQYALCRTLRRCYGYILHHPLLRDQFIGYIPCMLLLVLVDPIQCILFSPLWSLSSRILTVTSSPRRLSATRPVSRDFWVIFGMLVGQGLFGFVGLIIGIPLFAVVYSFTKNRVKKRLENKDLPSDSNVYRDIHHIDDETNEPVYFPHPPYMKKEKEKHEFKDIKKIFVKNKNFDSKNTDDKKQK